MSTQPGATRWWENYLVRYFIPSVAGMIILRWLDTNVPCSISNYLPVFLLKDWKDFDTAHFILWFLFGSLYCYIASYPVLVVHATRALDFKDKSGVISCWGYRFYIFTIIFFAVFSYIAAYCKNLYLAFGSVIIFASVQLWRLYQVYAQRHRFQFKKEYETSLAYAYLAQLGLRRGEGVQVQVDMSHQKRSDLGELVESYRHLREHGNTAFIVFLEIALCPIFFVALQQQKSSVDFAYLAILILIWIFPAVLVYLLAQHLERRYSLFKTQEEWAAAGFKDTNLSE